MAAVTESDLLRRYAHNPVITAEDVPFTCNTVFNGSPLKWQGEYLLLLRVEGQHGYSLFALARSRDGYEFDIEHLPVLTPATDGPMARWPGGGGFGRLRCGLGHRAHQVAQRLTLVARLAATMPAGGPRSDGPV